MAWRRWVLGALVVGAAGSGCSVIVDGAEHQCDIDADCQARGLPANATCSPDHVCVGPGGACTTNAQCGAQNGGQPAICRASDHTCVPLLSSDCERVIGPWDNDSAVVLGSILSLKGTNQSSGVAEINSVELAMGDFTNSVVGLPGGTGDKPRPLVVVSCDDSSDNDTAVRSANHLVDVGVPAIIGPDSSGLVTAVINSVTIPAKVLLISPAATSATLTGVSPYFWRTSPSDTIQAVPIRFSVNELETAFKAQHNVSQVKLAILYKDDAYGNGLFGSVTQNLTLNGKAVSNPSNAGAFLPLQYKSDGSNLPDVVASVLQFEPSIIAVFGTNEGITGVVDPVEQAWGALSGSPPLPLYMLSDGGEVTELTDACATSTAGLRTRVRGTVPGTNNALFQAFSLRYQGKFGSPASVFGMAGSYDSLYLLAYAITSLGTAPVDGTGVSQGMAKMVGGGPIDVGPSTIKTAFQALGSGNAIDINGASGPLDFDLTAHEAPSDIDVWCVGLDGSSNPVFVSSGRAYDSQTGQMTGTFKCP